MKKTSRGGQRVNRSGSQFIKSTPQTEDEALKHSNGGDYTSKADYMRNCQRCVWAYELNRRGYNVEAIGRNKSDNMGQNLQWLSIAKNPKLEYIAKSPFGRNTNAQNAKNVADKMKSWGDGSRGIIEFRTNSSSGGIVNGHVANVEYKNGKVTVYDAQSGKKETSLKKYLTDNNANATFSRIMRTDNLSLNKSEFSNYVRKRK